MWMCLSIAVRVGLLKSLRQQTESPAMFLIYSFVRLSLWTEGVCARRIRAKLRRGTLLSYQDASSSAHGCIH
jgi:hypothetical protein